MSQVEYSGRSSTTKQVVKQPRQTHADLAKFATCGKAYPGVSFFVVENEEEDEERAADTAQETKVSTATTTTGDKGQPRLFLGRRLQPVGVYGRVIVAATSFADGYCGDINKTNARFQRRLLSDLPGGQAVVAERADALNKLGAAAPESLREVNYELTVYDTGDNGRILEDGTIQV